MTIDETNHLTPPTVDQRPGRGRIKTWAQDRAENNNRSAGDTGRIELLEENAALLDERLAAIEGHLCALHAARSKAAV